MFLTAFFIALVQVPETFANIRFREIVVREVIPASHPAAAQETSYYIAAPLGDHDGNAQMDFLVAGLGIETNLRDAELFKLRSGLQEGPHDRFHSGFWTRFYPQTGFGPEGPILALLSTPQTPRLAILDIQGDLTLWDIPSRTSQGAISIPPPPVPGLPGADVLTSIAGDTDVNADGWSDLFFQDRNGGYGISGLINGRTRQAVWQGLTNPPVWRIAPIYNDCVASRPDLNRDGHPDFLAGFEMLDPMTQAFWHRVIAYSGADGGVLWTSELDGYLGWACQGLDWTGDGVPEVVQATSLFLQGVDGATGRTLWIQPESALTGRAPPNLPVRRLAPPVWVQIPPPVAGGAQAEPDVWCRVDLGPNTGSLAETAFVVLDAQSGSVRDFILQPDSMRPWRDYALHGLLDFNNFTPLGDVDRDGLKEFGNPFYALDVDDPNNPVEAYHYVIYGQRTLITPVEASLGEAVALSVWIPSAPGHEVYLLASDSFESEAGYLVDGWRTRLGPSALLTATQLAQPGRTILDAQGLGSVRFKVPNLQNLSGKKLYLRVIVERPGGTGEVWTISSVGEITIR